ncbi:YopX family protein [Sporolactobacillus terrae]|uniref:YopX family protein n=1 Tax=Sporolactobacillus terrae TaxID=269673 RepID=UPI00048EBCE2|nr:YopX family protein [Sporolactobacillus terrae]
MTREIKFRLYCKKTEEMADWNSVKEAIDSNEFSVSDILEMVEDDAFSAPMQYTGLHDKNGREIYEGDIVHSKTLVNGFESIGQVIFRDAHFLFQAINSQFGSSGWVSDLGIVLKEYEVIGNIYENPDLLKEGKTHG